MTLLTIVNDAQDLIGIPRSTVVATSTDDQVKQLLALANISGRMLARRHQWTALNQTATFTTVATEQQGLMESIAPGYDYNINQTMWNQSTAMFIDGSITPQSFQAREALSLSGPFFQFRIKAATSSGTARALFLQPVPTAGQTVAFEYQSRYWCQNIVLDPQERWADDEDTSLLDETLLTMDLRWRFLQAKGLNYAEAFREFEVELDVAIGRDGARKVISLDNCPDSTPTVIAPPGSWTP